MIKAAVYDPAQRSCSERWIWETCLPDVAWENVKYHITGLDVPSPVVTGVAVHPGNKELRCLFRRYEIGLDTFNRPGRFIIALVQIDGKDDLLKEEISVFLSSIEEQLEYSQSRYIELVPSGFRWTKVSNEKTAPDASLRQVYGSFDRMNDIWAVWGVTSDQDVVGFEKWPTTKINTTTQKKPWWWNKTIGA